MMHSIGWGVVLMAIALVGNIVLRRLVRFVDALDGTVNSAHEDERFVTDVSNVDVEELMASYGQVGEPYVFLSEHLPVSSQLLSVATQYEKIVFNEFDETFIRSYLDHPYEANPNYIRIGSMEDGSPVLMKCKTSEDTVYVVWVEDGDDSNPELYADSLKEYMAKCWNVFQNSR